MRIVNDTAEYCIGGSGVTDEDVPGAYRQLSRKEGGPTLIAFLNDFEEVEAPALTDDSIDELSRMLASAQDSAENWRKFFECSAEIEEIVERVKTKYLRQQSVAYVPSVALAGSTKQFTTGPELTTSFTKGTKGELR